MKDALRIILLLAFGLPLIASAGPLCALSNTGFDQTTDYQPSQIAMQHMNQVNSILCNRFSCPGYTLLSNPNAGNAMAWLNQTGSIIRFNPNFMNDQVGKYGSLATIGILAHELGHLIDFANNPGNQIAQKYREAKADEYAGCAFALAGNPKSDLQPLASSLFAMGSSPGYPTAQERVQLVGIGYDKCSQ